MSLIASGSSEADRQVQSSTGSKMDDDPPAPRERKRRDTGFAGSDGLVRPVARRAGKDAKDASTEGAVARPGSAPLPPGAKGSARFPALPFHLSHPLTSKRLRFLAWHLLASDFAPLTRLSSNGHKLLFTFLLCPLMLVSMHTTSAFTFTPKYRRFLDLITYPNGSLVYHRIRYCSDLHSPLKGCGESFTEEWQTTVKKISSLYLKFYVVRTLASLLFALLRKRKALSVPSPKSAANYTLNNIVTPFARSTLYLSSHMLLHRILMCTLVPKPLDAHRGIYYLIAATASSMCFIESGKRMGVINRMLAVYLVTELGVWGEQVLLTRGTNWRGSGLLGSKKEAEKFRLASAREVELKRALTPSHGSTEPLLINTPAEQVPKLPLWAIGRPDSSLWIAALYLVIAVAVHTRAVANRELALQSATSTSLAASAAFGTPTSRKPQGTQSLTGTLASALFGARAGVLSAPSFAASLANFDVRGLQDEMKKLPWTRIARGVAAGVGMAAVSSAMM